MENKKLGLLILAISIAAGVLSFSFMGLPNKQTTSLRCYPTQECQRVESLIGLSHLAVGLISFIGALGVYLLFLAQAKRQS